MIRIMCNNMITVCLSVFWTCRTVQCCIYFLDLIRQSISKTRLAAVREVLPEVS